MSGLKEPLEPMALEVLMGGGDGVIERQEARGQARFVKSDYIPVELLRCTMNDLTDLGFELGEVLEDDPLFRHAKLPEGWSKVPSEHSMWSHIVDETGTRRAAIFYKAAFYDRHAHLSLDQV